MSQLVVDVLKTIDIDCVQLYDDFLHNQIEKERICCCSYTSLISCSNIKNISKREIDVLVRREKEIRWRIDFIDSQSLYIHKVCC